MRSTLALVSLASVFLLVPIAHAQLEGGGAPPPSPESLTPPSVLEGVEAAYPPDALAAGLTGAVDLVVTIDTEGVVTDVQVPNPIGNGFDEAAIDALRRFRFTPATRGGTPIVARIRYRYVFSPPAPEPEPVPVEAPAPTTGRLAGEVHAEADDAPVAAATITITEVATSTARTITADADGRFVVDELAPGTYRIGIAAAGLAPVTYEETVVAGEETSLLYRVPAAVAASADDEETYTARAAIDPPPRELTRRTIEREALFRMPGTGGDALRAIEILPGVGRPPFGIGFVLIRGSGPFDSLVTLDGVPIPSIYHFGGLRSVYNSRLIERNVLYPGNFSSRYGRATGGVIEVESRDPATDRIHGIVDLNAVDASVLVEGPVSRKLSIVGAFRRSIIGNILPAVMPASAGFTAVPAYYDYQLMAVWRPTPRDRVKFQFYGSSDRFGLIAKSESEANESAAENAIGLKDRFNLFQVNWNRTLRGNTDQSIVFQIGPTHTEFTAGTFLKFDLDQLQMYGRSQWLTRFGSHLRLVTGLDVNAAPYRVTYVGPPPVQDDGTTTQAPDSQVGVTVSGAYARPAAYADLAIEQGPWLVNVALRTDYYSDIRSFSVDPRLLANYTIRPQWKLKAAAGLYSAPPAPQYSVETIGNPNLGPIHSAHLGAGVDYMPLEGMKFGVEGFYKPIWNNVVSGQNPGDPVFTNDGTGRIYGLEVSAAITSTPTRHYFAYVSYTLLRSERRDHPGDPWRAYDYDQTHMLNAAFSYYLPHNWELGAAVRFFTGNPYTPVVGRLYNGTQTSYQPILGAVNSMRNPNYNRIDFRVQKTWQLHGWKLAWYLDIQNLFNHQNQEAVIYNYDFALRGKVKGLPIIPALGLRGEF